MSLQALLLNGFLRRVEKPRIARASSPEVLRRNFELNAKLLFHAPRGTTRKWRMLGPIEALEVTPPGPSRDNVLFYIHGGGFVFGSPRTHAALAAQIAKRINGRAVLPRYRLAPEFPFPAAPQDVRAAWDALIADGVRTDQIIVGGDSAGGALALGLLASLCAEQAPLPAAVFAFSPLTDLTFQGDSFQNNETAEVLLPASRATSMKQMFLRNLPCTDPRCHPVAGHFTGAPPVWLTVGDTEILRDGSHRMAKVLRRDGVDTTFEERHDLPHVWPIFHNILPEARQTLDQLAAWMRRVAPTAAASPSR